MACCRIVDIRNKEVISIEDGCRIGFVNDVEIDIQTAKIVSIVIFGRLKCFGLFGRYDDAIISWDKIKIIGEDTILVHYSSSVPIRRRTRFFWRLMDLS